MSQNTIKSAVPREDDMPLDRQRTDVLERLWDEAEKSVAAQRVSLPMGNSGGLQFGGPVGS